MDDIQLADYVQSIIDQVRAAPFLFVGTGLSIRYLGADNWEELLRRFAADTDESFGFYVAKAKHQSSSASRTEIYPRIGTLINEAFFDAWYNEQKYAKQRQHLEAEDALPSSPLKYEVAKLMRKLSERSFPKEYREEIETLKGATVDGVITTNYDTLLNRLFDDYTVYSGQDGIIFAEQHAIAEIYKIHGSCDDPDSLVLTWDDYQEFEERNAYLAAKLITIFLEHPVIFLGYSIGDPNVRSILKSVINCLDDERLGELSQRMIFVEWSRDPKPAQVTTREIDIGEDGGRGLEVTRIVTHSFTPIYEALSRAQRQLSAKLMRRMKKQMYELVQTNEPQEQIHVFDIEEAESHDDIEFVIGVGVRQRLAERGAIGVEINQLFRDLVTDGNEFDDIASAIVNGTLRKWIKGNRKLTPIYKYMHLAGFLDENGLPIREEIPGKVALNALLPKEEFVYSSQINEDTKAKYRHASVAQVVEEKARHLAAAYITFIEAPELEAIEAFLWENRDMFDGSDNRSYHFKRLACIYDRMRYGPGFEIIAQYRNTIHGTDE